MRPINLVPKSTDYATWLKTTAMAMNQPDLLKRKTGPSQRLIDLANLPTKEGKS